MHLPPPEPLASVGPWRLSILVRVGSPTRLLPPRTGHFVLDDADPPWPCGTYHEDDGDQVGEVGREPVSPGELHLVCLQQEMTRSSAGDHRAGQTCARGRRDDRDTQQNLSRGDRRVPVQGTGTPRGLCPRSRACPPTASKRSQKTLGTAALGDPPSQRGSPQGLQDLRSSGSQWSTVPWAASQGRLLAALVAMPSSTAREATGPGRHGLDGTREEPVTGTHCVRGEF